LIFHEKKTEDPYELKTGTDCPLPRKKRVYFFRVLIGNGKMHGGRGALKTRKDPVLIF
jgi:hypothetical protein